MLKVFILSRTLFTYYVQYTYKVKECSGSGFCNAITPVLQAANKSNALKWANIKV